MLPTCSFQLATIRIHWVQWLQVRHITRLGCGPYHEVLQTKCAECWDVEPKKSKQLGSDMCRFSRFFSSVFLGFFMVSSSFYIFLLAKLCTSHGLRWISRFQEIQHLPRLPPHDISWHLMTCRCGSWMFIEFHECSWDMEIPWNSSLRTIHNNTNSYMFMTEKKKQVEQGISVTCDNQTLPDSTWPYDTLCKV